MPVVFIPTMLRPLSGGVRTIEVRRGSLADVIAELERCFPGMGAALVDEGELRPGLAASIDGETVSSLLEPVPEHSEVHFIPAISGGE